MSQSDPVAGGDEPPAFTLWHALLWVFGAAIAAQIAGGLVADFIRALLETRGAKPEQLDQSPWVVIPALVASGSALLGVTVLAAALSGVPLRKALGLRRAPLSAYALAALGTLALGPTGDGLMRLAAELYPSATLGVVPMLNELVSATPAWVVVPAFALLPGLSEELAFRGLVQNAPGRAGIKIALSALLFALFHVDPHHVIGVLPLGLFLAWVGARYGALVTIVAHVMNNSVAIAMVKAGHTNAEVAPPSFLVASWVVVIGCVIALAFRRTGERRHAHTTVSNASAPLEP